jgi:hypothetical protein
MLAAFADHGVFSGRDPVRVLRGQVFTSQVKLAARWDWNRKTVRGFLDTLKAASMVDIHTSKDTDTGYTLITISNYERFQGEPGKQPDIGSVIGADIEPAIERTSNGHRVPTHKNERTARNEEVTLRAPNSPNGGDKGADQPIRTLLGEYQQQFERKFSEKPNLDHRKDPAILQRLIKKYGQEKVSDFLRAFFSSTDQWIQKSGYTVGAFSVSINKLIAQKAQPGQSRRRVNAAWEGQQTGRVKL